LVVTIEDSGIHLLSFVINAGVKMSPAVEIAQRENDMQIHSFFENKHSYYGLGNNDLA
jgi:hypothetical protein